MVEWRPVVGYEGYYEVSSDGQVRGVTRELMDCLGRDFVRKSRLLTRRKNKDGYLTVNLSRDSKRKRVFVHRIVLEAFVGSCPEGMETRHLDGNPENNSVNNLCWGTHKENMVDVKRHGRQWNLNKTHCRHGHPFSGSNLCFDKSGRRVCLACRRAKDKRLYEKNNYWRGPSNKEKTHCKNGHEFTEENTYQGPGRQHRKCRECHRITEKRRRDALKEVIGNNGKNRRTRKTRA